MEGDRSYYARRAAAEWRAAVLARDAESRRLHFELAEMLHVKASLRQPSGQAFFGQAPFTSRSRAVRAGP